MSEAFQYIDILILAIIAGIVLLRLRSVLGKRTGHEKTDKTSYNYEAPRQSQTEKVIPIEPEKSSSATTDSWFDNDDFLRGASNAYEMIVTNFENGNKDALKSLLSEDVMNSFSSVIDERNSKNETVEFNFIGIEKSEIVHKDLKKNPMEVSVRFISEMITCIKNSKDEVISGSLNQVQKITDIWTFEKYSNRKGSNWLLVATSD
ncbi:MAG: preprotein translocase subunit Tim44 [Rickettsiales bacterium]|jgi:predicted lipid-binding transport protein (Tim44 family)|nr:preprotein translocase subunit Tim44 [Rickettsiales bacterium]|tara:strand:- start:2523 stop:3137 length:615 start_codon:yes stop_codon:yes gene_type:complete